MHDKLNKILQMDCLEYLKELPDKCVDLVLIDPPYEIEIKGGKKIVGNLKNSNYHKDLENIANGFPEEILEEICRVCKIINCYIFCSKTQIPKLLNFFILKKCHFDILTWHKLNPPPLCGDSYLPDTEYILYFRRKNATFNNGYQTKSKYFISTTNQNDKKKYQHPTCKPVELLIRYITNSSNKGDVVLDCFMGSGSTALACYYTERNFLGCEREEKYVKIAEDRLRKAKDVLI